MKLRLPRFSSSTCFCNTLCFALNVISSQMHPQLSRAPLQIRQPRNQTIARAKHRLDNMKHRPKFPTTEATPTCRFTTQGLRRHSNLNQEERDPRVSNHKSTRSPPSPILSGTDAYRPADLSIPVSHCVGQILHRPPLVRPEQV